MSVRVCGLWCEASAYPVYCIHMYVTFLFRSILSSHAYWREWEPITFWPAYSRMAHSPIKFRLKSVCVLCILYIRIHQSHQSVGLRFGDQSSCLFFLQLLRFKRHISGASTIYKKYKPVSAIIFGVDSLKYSLAISFYRSCILLDIWGRLLRLCYLNKSQLKSDVCAFLRSLICSSCLV